MIRLAASDIDGTIKPYGGEISDRTKDAVRRWIASGRVYALSSGRSLPAALEIARELGMAEGYVIYAGGGAVADIDGRVLREWTMPPDAARRVYEIARFHPVRVNAFVPGAVLSAHAGYYPNTGTESVLDDAPFDEGRIAAPYKMEIYTSDPALRLRLLDEYRRAGFDVTWAAEVNLEIMMPGTGKGAALDWLGGRLGIPREERCAFGDNTNDLSLLDACGLSFAMGNAAEPLKRAARIVCGSDRDDGEALALEAIMNGEISL